MNLKVLAFPSSLLNHVLWRACLLYILTCSHILHARCAQISYVLHAYVLGVLVSYLFYIWKEKFQKFLYRKTSFHWEKYLEQTWTSMMEFFVKKNLQKGSITDLRLGFNYACGIVRFFVYTYFIFIDTNLKTYILKPTSRKHWSQYQ